MISPRFVLSPDDVQWEHPEPESVSESRFVGTFANLLEDKDAGGHGSAKHSTGAAAPARKGILGRVQDAEHALTGAIVATVAKLPAPAQAVVKGTYHAAMSTFTAGQALAERVARERGLSAEQAGRLRGTLFGLDVALAKPVAIAGEVAGLGLAPGFVPVASTGYILYSTAVNPLATYRAAKGLVSEAAERLRSATAPPSGLATATQAKYARPGLTAVGEAKGKGGQFAPGGGHVPGSGPALKAGKAKKAPVAAKIQGKAPSQKVKAALDGIYGDSANRPSAAPDRHAGAAPKAVAWQDPPPKKGVKGGGPAVRPTGDDAQGKQGDIAEERAQRLGFRNILPLGQRHFSPAQKAAVGSSIDLELDHSGRLYELKMCKTTSTEYRLKAKAEEKDAKLRFAKNVQGDPYTMVGVHDVDKGEVHFYAAKKPGLIGSEVNPKDYDYLGAVPWTDTHGSGK